MVRSAKPMNAETPLELLAGSLITPTELFYVRNHLPVPVSRSVHNWAQEKRFLRAEVSGRARWKGEGSGLRGGAERGRARTAMGLASRPRWLVNVLPPEPQI